MILKLRQRSKAAWACHSLLLFLFLEYTTGGKVSNDEDSAPEYSRLIGTGPDSPYCRRKSAAAPEPQSATSLSVWQNYSAKLLPIPLVWQNCSANTPFELVACTATSHTQSSLPEHQLECCDIVIWLQSPGLSDCVCRQLQYFHFGISPIRHPTLVSSWLRHVTGLQVWHLMEVVFLVWNPFSSFGFPQREEHWDDHITPLRKSCNTVRQINYL